MGGGIVGLPNKGNKKRESKQRKMDRRRRQRRREEEEEGEEGEEKKEKGGLDVNWASRLIFESKAASWFFMKADHFLSI